MPECGCGCCKTMFSHDLRPGKGAAWLEMARVTLQAPECTTGLFFIFPRLMAEELMPKKALL